MNCLFKPDVYITICPNLKTIYIDNCKGVINIVGMRFERLVLGSEKDRLCYVLKDSKVVYTYSAQTKMQRQLLKIGKSFGNLMNHSYEKVEYNFNKIQKLAKKETAEEVLEKNDYNKSSKFIEETV